MSCLHNIYKHLQKYLPSPSSQVIPKKTWSLVVSQTEESTNKLRAVPKVSMLLSAMEEAFRGQQHKHANENA